MAKEIWKQKKIWSTKKNLRKIGLVCLRVCVVGVYNYIKFMFSSFRLILTRLCANAGTQNFIYLRFVATQKKTLRRTIQYLDLPRGLLRRPKFSTRPNLIINPLWLTNARSSTNRFDRFCPPTFQTIFQSVARSCTTYENFPTVFIASFFFKLFSYQLLLLLVHKDNLIADGFTGIRFDFFQNSSTIDKDFLDFTNLFSFFFLSLAIDLTLSKKMDEPKFSLFVLGSPTSATESNASSFSSNAPFISPMRPSFLQWAPFFPFGVCTIASPHSARPVLVLHSRPVLQKYPYWPNSVPSMCAYTFIFCVLVCVCVRV